MKFIAATTATEVVAASLSSAWHLLSPGLDVFHVDLRSFGKPSEQTARIAHPDRHFGRRCRLRVVWTVSEVLGNAPQVIRNLLKNFITAR